jgi:dolichol-phosphate mannosyltransferase
MSPSHDLAVIVFAYNEAENVGPILGELRAWLQQQEPDAEIIFVDDGSTDATADAARDALGGCAHQVVRHAANRGIGAAIKSGVEHTQAKWITFLPADGQIEPLAIGVLRDAQRSDGADVVFSLYADRNDGLDRKVLSYGMRALVHAIHGVKLSSDGPYLFRRDLFTAQPLHSDSFFLNLELPIRVLLGQHRAAQVTIRCRPRRSGVSKSAKLKVIGRVARELIAFRARRMLE